MDILAILQFQFFQRALLAGIAVSLLCALWGVFIVLRKQAYLSDAVAHASLTGIAVGILLGWSHLPLAILAGVLLAVGITYFKKHTNLSDDTLIGILYSFLFAIGVVLLSFYPGYRPDLFSYLFGSLLAVSWTDLTVDAVLLIVSLLFVGLTYRKLLYVTFDPEAATLRGIKTERYEYLINILSSIATIVAIKSVGIVMVSALILIPSASAKLMARKFSDMLPLSMLFSTSSAVIGIFASYILNLPSGAAIVIVAGLGFFSLVLFKNFTKLLKRKNV